MSEKDFIDKSFENFQAKLTKGLKGLIKDKTKFSVFLIFIFGFILRIFAARNQGYYADDANHAIIPVGIFPSGKLVIWSQSTALWYYIQGIFYKIFGPTTMASSFAAALFGSLLIILMFLFVKKVFKSDKAAISSSFLIAFSPLLITNTMPEMDVAMSFFVVLSAYTLFSYFESEAKKDLIFSALFISVAIMIKFYAIIFAASFLIYLIYRQLRSKSDSESKVNLSKILKSALLFVLIVFIFIIPIFAHNYLLYQDKGYVDYLFTQFTKVGIDKSEEIYNWGAGWDDALNVKGFFLGHSRWNNCYGMGRKKIYYGCYFYQYFWRRGIKRYRHYG